MERSAFLTDPALTVLDLTDTLGSAAISDALRRDVTTIERLEEALEITRFRQGNKRRAQMVREARDAPWSELEREAHVRLRRAHFPGWVANHPVMIRGRLYFIDIAVPEAMLAAEIDGWSVHRTHEAFIADRIKWNDLALAGWRVLHFTDSTLDDLVPQLQEMLGVPGTRWMSTIGPHPPRNGGGPPRLWTSIVSVAALAA